MKKQMHHSLRMLQIVALCMIYLIVQVPFVYGQPAYAPDELPSAESKGIDTTDTDAAEPASSTSPFAPADAEAPGGEFSEERGAYALLLELDVPSKTNQRALTLQGTTNPHATVKAYLNPPSPPSETTAYSTITIADRNGAFGLTLTLQEGSHHLVVVAEGKETDTTNGIQRVHKVTKDFDFVVDTTSPVVSIDEKLIISEGALVLKGTTSENILATTTIEGAVHEEAIQKGPFELRVPVPAAVAQRFGEKTDVLFLFTDEAGNVKRDTKNILILGGPPRLFSHNLYELSPSYTQTVTVRGNATPGAVVLVTVNGEVTPDTAWSSSLLDMVRSLPLRAGQGKEYTAVAKQDGSFEIDVLLTQQLETNFTQALPQQPMREDVRTFGREYDIGRSFENLLQIFVVDELGRSAQSEPVGIIFAKCSSAGYWGVETSKSTPSTVIPEHLRRGLAQLGFNVKLQWRGPSDRANILAPPRVRVLRQSTDVRNQYAFDPELLVRNPIQASWSDDYTAGGVVVNLNALPYIQKNLSDLRAKKDLLIKIPLQLEVLFEYDQSGGLGPSAGRTDYQGGIGAPPGTAYVSGGPGQYGEQQYQQTIPGVITDQPQKVTRSQLHCIDVTTILDLEFDERWLPEWLLKDSIEFFDDAIGALNEILQYLKFILIGTFVTCLGSFVAYYYKLVVEKMNCLGVSSTQDDTDPEKQLCLKSIEDRQTYERYMKWVCDRVYCPAAPSLGVHIPNAQRAKAKAFQGSGEKPDEYSLGGSDVDAKESACGLSSMTEAKVYQEAGDLLSTSSSLLTPFKQSVAVPSESDGKKCAREYLNQWNSVCWSTNELRQSQCLYETMKLAPGAPAPESCGGPIGLAVEAASTICQEEIRPLEGSIRFGGTLPTRKVWVQIEEERDETGAIIQKPDKKQIEVSDRWFKYLSNGQWEVGTIYDDVREVRITDPVTGASELRLQSQGDKQFVSEFPKKILSREEAEKYGLIPRVNRDYVVDPTSGIINSVRCMCLPALNTYVALLQRVFTQFKQCFQSILLTGEGSTGMCRRAFSETLCDFTIEAIRCFAQRYGAGYGGARAGRPEGIGTFFSAIASAGDHMHTTISERYGRTNLYQILNERSLVHSACFYAFTGDFDLDIEGALTGIGSVPVASEGFLYPKQTRRFITSSPVTGNARFIYHIAGGLVAGSEVTYGAELICTASPTNCKQIYGFANSRCDCTDLGEKRYPITNFLGSGTLAAGEYVDMDEYLPVELPYRFDRVRLYWTWRNNEGVMQTEEKIVEIQGIGDPPPVTCQFTLSGYRCEVIAGQYGRAAFIERPKPLKSVFFVNDPIEVEVKVEKYSPGTTTGTVRPDFTQPLTPAQPVPFFLVYQLRDQMGNVVAADQYVGTRQTFPGSSVARAMSVRALVEDGLTSFTIPGLVLTEPLITRGMYGGAAGYARSIGYTNPDFGEAVPNKIPLRTLPQMDVTYPQRENLAFGLLVFKTKDSAGRDRFCYGVQRASLNPDQTSLLEGSRNYQFEIVPGALPCTDIELAASGLAPATQQKLKNNLYLFDTALGTISYHGVQLRPEYGGLESGKLYADGYVFLAQSQAAATQCRDITAANPAHWKLHLELRPCKVREEGDIPGIDTCLPGDAVVRFGGRTQEYIGADAIDIPVACEESKTLGALDRCPPNQLVQSECQCIGTDGTSRCGIAQGLNYCTASGSCTGYEACQTTDRNNGLPVDPSNRQNICDCNGKLGGNTDMECGVGDYCAPCPAAYPNQYACVGSPDYFVKNPSQAAALCVVTRPSVALSVPPGPPAPGTGAVNPVPPGGVAAPVRIPGPLLPQPVTLGTYGPATIDPSTICGADDSCRFYARADNILRPQRAQAIDSVVIHITAMKASAYDTYRNVFFGATNKGTHYIIDRDGSLLQIENEDIITSHAGCNQGNPACAIPDVNSRSIGIDLANYAGGTECANCVDVRQPQTAPHGTSWTFSGSEQYWEPFPNQQMKTLVQLLTELVLRHGINLNNIYFHSTTGRPRYNDGKTGYACEGFEPNRPAGVYAGHEDPGPLFDWCRVKAAVQQAFNEYNAAQSIVAAAPEASAAQGATLASGFFTRLTTLCATGIDENCLRANNAFVVQQFNQYYDLCRDDDCRDSYVAELGVLVGDENKEVILELDEETELPTGAPTELDGRRFARQFISDIQTRCNPITRACLDANKRFVAQKVGTYADFCEGSPACDNLFTGTLINELGTALAQRIDEIYGEIGNR